MMLGFCFGIKYINKDTVNVNSKLTDITGNHKSGIQIFKN